METLRLYFSDFFGIDADIIEAYGAINISLINDLPLFIDPFLLFNSENERYQKIHRDIIDYLLYLQLQAEKYPQPPKGLISNWYRFPEIKQTWLGFSLDGNAGRGLGKDFAVNLHKGLQTVFKDFGKETISRSSHLEKLCLISPLVGRDKISDFATNFAKEYLLEYTEIFAKEYLEPSQCRTFAVRKVSFSYKTGTWVTKKYYLPCYNDDFILLTPRDLLTRDDTFINRPDMVSSLQYIAPAIEDASLRFALNQYFVEVLPKKKSEMSKTDKDKVATSIIAEHPELIDYYIKYKEDRETEATSISKQVVEEVVQLFNVQLQALANLLSERTDFYSVVPDSHAEAKKRVMFLKTVIKLSGKFIWAVTSIGIPTAVIQICLAVATSLTNIAAKPLPDSDLIIAAYGVVQRLILIGCYIVMGFMQGYQPVAAYAFGAKNEERFHTCVRFALKGALLLTIVVASIYILLAQPLISLFNHNPAVIDFGKKLLISQVALYPAFGLCYMMTITYQTMGSAKMGLFLSLIRQGVFYAPFIILLPKLSGVTGIYFSQPAADVLTMIVCLFLIKPMKRLASKNIAIS